MSPPSYTKRMVFCDICLEVLQYFSRNFFKYFFVDTVGFSSDKYTAPQLLSPLSSSSCRSSKEAKDLPLREEGAGLKP